MRKIILVLFAFIALIFSLSCLTYATNVSAKGAVLIEADSGRVIFEKNKDAVLPMASTTKIMTALVTIENANCNDTVKIEPYMSGIEGSSIYLKVGEELSVSELLYALMLESANDAAVALAYHVGGSIEEFARLMNEKAKSLGLENTNFTNPHGLDSTDHYTTAHELGIITSCAMKNPEFKKIVSTYKTVIPARGESYERLLVNHNRLLRSYKGALGVKTGYTKKCGRCLVSCAERDGVTLICVTLNDPNDWQDHAKLLDYGFDSLQSVTLSQKNGYVIELNTINGKKSSFLAETLDDVSVTLPRNNINISATLEAQHLIPAPIQKGDVVGKIVFYNNGEQIASVPIYAKETVDAITYKKSFLKGLFK